MPIVTTSMDSVRIPSRSLAACALALACAMTACAGTSPTSSTNPTDTSASISTSNTNPAPQSNSKNTEWDIEKQGIPRFVSHQYLDLDAIYRISRFRSGEGHTYVDEFESCRSMKHYFQPVSTADWSTIRISSPVEGTIVFLRAEQTFGTQVAIRATAQPAFTFIIFHVALIAGIDSGARVTAGQRIGSHIGTQTMSDIAVGVNTPGGYKLVSWFETMTDELFASYAARGVAARTSAIITKSDRDNNRLTCDGEAFVGTSTLDNWLTLR